MTADAALTSQLLAEWPFPVAAAMGSSVRAKGIEQELRAKLPFPRRNDLNIEGGTISLRLAADHAAEFEHLRARIADALAGIGALPLLPREVEDVLGLSPRERLKWTKDGRLQSAGTRTVKLRGRAKAVTFHVFDRAHVEDVLDADLPALWREADREATAENRQRAAGRAALTRAARGEGAAAPSKTRKTRRRRDGSRPVLAGWDAFAAEGLLD